VLSTGAKLGTRLAIAPKNTEVQVVTVALTLNAQLKK